MADSHEAGDLCPLCQKFERSGNLQLRQINAYEALWLCDNPVCLYPLHLDLPTVPNLLPELVAPSLSLHTTHFHLDQITPTGATNSPNTTTGCNREPNEAIQPSAPNNAHPYPLDEYSSLQEELSALFEDDVTDLFGDSPGDYYDYTPHKPDGY